MQTSFTVGNIGARPELTGFAQISSASADQGRCAAARGSAQTDRVGAPFCTQFVPPVADKVLHGGSQTAWGDYVPLISVITELSELTALAEKSMYRLLTVYS